MATIKKTVAVLAEQTTNADGTITIRAMELADGREIRTAAAMKMLGMCKDTVHQLCQMGGKRGGLVAWKTESVRGNSHWRISLQSVLDYKARRISAAEDGY